MDFFQVVLRQEKIPIPEKEFKFCKDRNWRFDYAYPEKKLAIECDGGVWSNHSRHTRGSGYIKDLEKFNAAAILGWRILKYTPDQLGSNAIDDLKIILKLK